MDARHPRVRNLQYQRALEGLDAAAGPRPCATGCEACCVGAFDVSNADLRLVLEGIGGLDAPIRKHVLRRIREAAQLERRVSAATGAVSVSALGEDAFDAMCDAVGDTRCPLLVDGTCAIPNERPQPCRMRGAVWQLANGDTVDLRCAADESRPSAPVAFDLGAFEETAALFDRGLELPEVGTSRTTIASGIDAVLRAMRAATSG
jgi:Fe-S-cluster containining protein